MARFRSNIGFLKQVFPGLSDVVQTSVLVPLFEAAKQSYLLELSGGRPVKPNERPAKWGEVWYDLELFGCGQVWLLVESENLELRYAEPVFMARALTFEGPEKSAREVYNSFASFLRRQSLRDLKSVACRLLKDQGSEHFFLLDTRRYYEQPGRGVERSFLA